MALTALAQEAPLLPRRLGAINDYGQTLERASRNQLKELISKFSARGIELVYLASWRDPFGDPAVYARKVFQAWGLGPRAVLIVFLREGRRWVTAGVLGSEVPIPEERFSSLLSQAEKEAGRAPPAHALLKLVTALLELPVGRGEASSARRGLYIALGLVLGGGAMWLVARSRLCPRWASSPWSWRRRAPWWSIILLCPRSYDRWTMRRRRGMGSRRGYLP